MCLCYKDCVQLIVVQTRKHLITSSRGLLGLGLGVGGVFKNFFLSLALASASLYFFFPIYFNVSAS